VSQAPQTMLAMAHITGIIYYSTEANVSADKKRLFGVMRLKFPAVSWSCVHVR